MFFECEIVSAHKARDCSGGLIFRNNEPVSDFSLPSNLSWQLTASIQCPDTSEFWTGFEVFQVQSLETLQKECRAVRNLPRVAGKMRGHLYEKRGHFGMASNSQYFARTHPTPPTSPSTALQPHGGTTGVYF